MFLYYLPGANGITLSHLVDHGLGYAFDRVAEIQTRVVKGPDDRQGILVGRKDGWPDGLDFAVHAESQTWRRIPGSEAWVGVYNDHRPGPEDLRRERRLGGYPAELGDGNTWIIPVAREPETGEPLLPCELDLDTDGRFRPGPVVPDWAYLWKIACTVYEACDLARDTAAVEFADSVTMAAAVLRANYYVGVAECVLLKLFAYHSPFAMRVLYLLIDLPGIYSLQKKAGSDSPNTGPGDSE